MRALVKWQKIVRGRCWCCCVWVGSRKQKGTPATRDLLEILDAPTNPEALHNPGLTRALRQLLRLSWAA